MKAVLLSPASLALVACNGEINGTTDRDLARQRQQLQRPVRLQLR